MGSEVQGFGVQGSQLQVQWSRVKGKRRYRGGSDLTAFLESYDIRDILVIAV